MTIVSEEETLEKTIYFLMFRKTPNYLKNFVGTP